MIIVLSISVVLLVLWNVWQTFKFLSVSSHLDRCVHRVALIRIELDSTEDAMINDRFFSHKIADAYAARFGVSVQDVLRQKQESAKQEKAYYAWKEQG